MQKNDDTINNRNTRDDHAMMSLLEHQSDGKADDQQSWFTASATHCLGTNTTGEMSSKAKKHALSQGCI